MARNSKLSGWDGVRACVATWLFAAALMIAMRFPYHTDPAPVIRRDNTAQRFYDVAYSPGAASRGPAPASAPVAEDPNEEIYVRIATRAAELFGIKPAIAKFVSDYHLESKRVLDVGSGRGYLQDMAPDYTGLDISGSVRRFYHKPFVQASATEMPFNDGEFDAAWSIWVLEHVPNPEQMLSEMRRVVKPGGLLYLYPAWYCTVFAANGYAVRPYSDFGFQGKLLKAGLPLWTSPLVDVLQIYPARAVRWAASELSTSPTRFHYRVLRPNYERYWMPDSDALNSMDAYEAYLWFTSRGDQCLNCGSGWQQFRRAEEVLIIRVNKPGRQAS